MGQTFEHSQLNKMDIKHLKNNNMSWKVKFQTSAFNMCDPSSYYHSHSYECKKQKQFDG